MVELLLGQTYIMQLEKLERSLLWSILRLGMVSASIVLEGDVRQKTGERESRIGARLIHILLRSGTGQRLGSKDNEECDTTSQD